MLDFAFLVENNFSAAGWGDQQGVWQALIDDLNARGGINGRTVEAVFDYYSPIGTNEAEETCTILTQDNEVFAVLGGFLGPFAGTVDPCIVGTNETMLIGGEIAPEELAQAIAPWYDSNPSTDRQTNTLVNLLVETGRSDGAAVFIISNQASEGDAAGVEAALTDAGVSVLETAVLDAPDSDQPAQGFDHGGHCPANPVQWRQHRHDQRQSVGHLERPPECRPRRIAHHLVQRRGRPQQSG